MPKTKHKNGRIELYRFLFALMILFFHIQKRFAEGQLKIGNTGLHFFSMGCIGVEFFFLVSGYLMAAGCYAKREVPVEFIGTETAQFIWKKIKSVFPYHIFATTLTLLVNAIFLYHSAASRFKYVLDSWAAIFMLQEFGFDTTWVNKLTWYLDVWLMISFIFYIFLRKHYDVFVKIVCPFGALAILGYIAHEYGYLVDMDAWTGFCYKAFLRGMADMALGCAAYSMTRRTNKNEYSRRGKISLAIVEVAGYIGIFLFSCLKDQWKYEFPVLIIMCALIVLTFSDINPCHRIFDHPVFSQLGKLSLLIYLNQFYVLRLVQQLLPDLGVWYKVIVCTAGTFVAAVICEFVIAHINFKGIKKWFLVQ